MDKREKRRREKFLIDDYPYDSYKNLPNLSPEECDKILNEARKKIEEKTEAKQQR